MKIFSFFKKRKRERTALASLQTYASAFAYLNTLRDSGLLLWQERNRRLFIMQPLAIIMMRNADSWRNFLTNCLKRMSTQLRDLKARLYVRRSDSMPY